MSDIVLIPFPGVGTLAMTCEQFQAAFSAGHELGTTSARPAPPATAIDELVDAQQLEQKTGVPQSWWMAQARGRRIPYRKIGRRVRFVFDEVIRCDAFLRREIPASGTPQPTSRELPRRLRL
jgi:hypothetical protein